MRIEEIQSYLDRISAKDPLTSNHCGEAARYAVLLGRRLGLAEEEIKKLHVAAVLHDLGKLWVPDEILFKPGKLTAEEYEVIKQHPEWGAEIIAESGIGDVDIQEIAELIRYHHERYDGRGYPFGWRGDEIPLLSQIISIADAYDAMTSDRPYRKAMSPFRAAQILREERGKQFNPMLVDLFLELVAVDVLQ